MQMRMIRNCVKYVRSDGQARHSRRDSQACDSATAHRGAFMAPLPIATCVGDPTGLHERNRPQTTDRRGRSGSPEPAQVVLRGLRRLHGRESRGSDRRAAPPRADGRAAGSRSAAEARGRRGGLATLAEILQLAPHTKVIVVTGNGDQENALTAVAQGAYDFYEKPVDTDTLKLLVDRAFNISELESENRRLQSQVNESPLDGIVAASEGMLAVCRMIEKVAPTDVTTLLLGESGTGKELLARALHRLSPRAENNFVAINCAAIPENLLESELFGHEKGAFTGAHKQTLGKVEVADGGTLFLDEIGDMPMALQAKMLRFLQERVIERVGGREEISVDVRVVCATNQNPADLISRRPVSRGSLLPRQRNHDQYPAVSRSRRRPPDSRPQPVAEIL